MSDGLGEAAECGKRIVFLDSGFFRRVGAGDGNPLKSCREQGMAPRKVTVKGGVADSRTARDLVQGCLRPLLPEQFLGDGQDPVPVTCRVRPQSSEAAARGVHIRFPSPHACPSQLRYLSTELCADSCACSCHTRGLAGPDFLASAGTDRSSRGTGHMGRLPAHTPAASGPCCRCSGCLIAEQPRIGSALL